ncbi:MAG: hypothetical protein GXO29_03915 [Thermotogae bacterium]|nr:hypothetical protein [Thermotogota bacterium]
MVLLMAVAPTVEPIAIGRPEDLVRLADSLPPHRLVKVLPTSDPSPEDSSLVWVGYTPQELVIYARLYQRGIKASSRRRDAPALLEGKEDHIRVVLNTKGWGVSSARYTVLVNPLGTVGDYYGHSQWDGENYARANIYDWGWDVLVRISFSTLDYVRQPWGFNISRTIMAKAELQMLSPNLKGDPALDAKLLLDWDRIVPRRALDVVLIPSFRLQSEADSTWDGALRSRRIVPMAGFTLRGKRGRSELLDLTVLPDFSDVDVDIKEFQLNRLPIDYPEKRPYFTEGQNYAPDRRLIRTRNLVQPLFGVKFYSAHRRNDLYVNALRDMYLGSVAFGRGTWRPTAEVSLASSFVITDSSDYQVFGGDGMIYVRPLNVSLYSAYHRNFPLNAGRLSLHVDRDVDAGLSFAAWYVRTDDGFLSPYNVRAINFDNVATYGLWMGYNQFYMPFGRSLVLRSGVEYNKQSSLDGTVLSEGGRGYYFIWIPPWSVSGSLNMYYYGYLRHLYHYDALYGIEDFTARYAVLSLPSYYASEWESVSLRVGFGRYLGHAMRSLSLQVQISPFGVNTGFLLYRYNTVLDDLTVYQYYGEIPLGRNVLLKPYLNYTEDRANDDFYLEGNMIVLWEPRPLTGVYLAMNKRLTGNSPQALHHSYEKEVFKVQVRLKVW